MKLLVSQEKRVLALEALGVPIVGSVPVYGGLEVMDYETFKARRSEINWIKGVGLNNSRENLGFLCATHPSLVRQIGRRGYMKKAGHVSISQIARDYTPCHSHIRFGEALRTKRPYDYEVAAHHAKVVPMQGRDIVRMRTGKAPFVVKHQVRGIAFLRRYGYSGDAPVWPVVKKAWRGDSKGKRAPMRWSIMLGNFASWPPGEAGVFAHGWYQRSTRHLYVGIDWIVANVPKR